MKPKTAVHIMFVCFVLMGFLFIRQLYISKAMDNIIQQDRCVMYDINETKYREGYYQRGKYYVVWVENRTEKQINEVEHHEECHDLVRLGYEHFCTWEKQWE